MPAFEVVEATQGGIFFGVVFVVVRITEVVLGMVLADVVVVWRFVLVVVLRITEVAVVVVVAIVVDGVVGLSK